MCHRISCELGVEDTRTRMICRHKAVRVVKERNTTRRRQLTLTRRTCLAFRSRRTRLSVVMSTKAPNQRFNRRSIPWTTITCFRAICCTRLGHPSAASFAASSACRLAHRFRDLHQREWHSPSAATANFVPPPVTNHERRAAFLFCWVSFAEESGEYRYLLSRHADRQFGPMMSLLLESEA